GTHASPGGPHHPPTHFVSRPHRRQDTGEPIRMNLHRTATLSTPAPPRRCGRRIGDPLAPGASRTDGVHRSTLEGGRRRTHTATSDRRNPQPRRTARIGRSRRPLGVLASGAFKSACACVTVSQLPSRTPFEATPFTRVIPFASSGASSPLS